MKFRVIAADPPWQHNSRHATRRDNPDQKTRLGMGARGHYRTCPTSEICAMGPYVQAVAAPDAYLFLWVLESMPEAVKPVLDAWGFEQVCTFAAWIKLNSKDGNPKFGVGKYSAGNLERMILARRNRKKYRCWHSTAKGCWKPPQVILEPLGPHSAKPETAQDRIDKWLDPFLGGYGKMEMFARRHRPGWVCLGDEITQPEIIDDLWNLANGYDREYLERAGLLVPA